MIVTWPRQEAGGNQLRKLRPVRRRMPHRRHQGKTNLDKVWRQLYDPGKRVVVQVAPRRPGVALGEAFGLAPGEDSIGKIFTAIRMLGFDAVVMIPAWAPT